MLQVFCGLFFFGWYRICLLSYAAGFIYPCHHYRQTSRQTNRMDDWECSYDMLYLVYIRIFFIDKLVMINCMQQTKVEDTFKNTLASLFPKLKIDSSSIKIITAKKEPTLLLWGKEVLCVIDEQTFFINILTIGRNDTRSPFHAIFNYLKCLQIKKQIESS